MSLASHLRSRFLPSPQLRVLWRPLCTEVLNNHPKNQWDVKQVTKANFSDSLEEIKTNIFNCDFIAVSLQSTGSFSASWQRVSSFDTADIAYLKARHSAEGFQLVQFAVCPFSVSDCKVTAYPYNFHIFPRDDWNIGVPCYSFSCQTSYITSMAQQGFDFNECIYNGISYLSRVQETAAKARRSNAILVNNPKTSSITASVADSVFTGRIRSRLKHWRNTCKETSTTRPDEALVRSLRKLIIGSEQYGSRPCMTIDVCSERQVQLVIEMLGEFDDDLVTLVIPAKGGGVQAVRVILTSSKDDKDLLEKEIQDSEDELNKKIRGFREVIDMISASQKPIISHNSLNDFTFVHSKFVAPLPDDIDKFMASLQLVFPHIFDIRHLMKDIGPLEKVNNVNTALSYLKTRYFSPFNIEIADKGSRSEGKIHGQNVVKICDLFVSLCSILKISPTVIQSGKKVAAPPLQELANIYITNSSETHVDEDVSVRRKSRRKTSCEHLVFLWGFSPMLSGGMLKNMLQQCHHIFSEEFDVRLVDSSCAIIVFSSRPGLSKACLDLIESNEIDGSLRDMVSDGLRAAGYEAYRTACKLGIWEPNLADSLDKAVSHHDRLGESSSNLQPADIYWIDDLINLDDL